MFRELKLANVEIRLPPDESLVGALRLLVSGLGARLGFNVDELEDLKFTVSEAFLAVVERSAGQVGVVTVRWEESPEQLTVRVTDPSLTHTSVATCPVVGLIERVADSVVYEKGDRKELVIQFRSPDAKGTPREG